MPDLGTWRERGSAGVACGLPFLKMLCTDCESPRKGFYSAPLSLGASWYPSETGEGLRTLLEVPTKERMLACGKGSKGRSDYVHFDREGVEADFFTAKDREVLESGRMFEIAEEPIHTRSHGVRLLHTKKIPILDERGVPEYLLGISEDITDRRRAEDELERANTEREQFA